MHAHHSAGAAAVPARDTRSDPATDDDQRFCRDALPRVSRTFALNTRVLAGPLGAAVRTGYLLCRAADTLEDSWPGEPGAIEDRFARFLRALRGDAAALASLSADARALGSDRADVGLLAELPRLLRVLGTLPAAHRAALIEGVTTLATGMGRYASRAAGRPGEVAYLDTEAELDDYCWIVAGCVGVMLTRLFAAEYGAADPATEAARLELAPVVGRALQLTNIFLDWPQDVRRGRCYLPASWLDEAGVSPRGLVEGPTPGARKVAGRLEARAREALARVPDYLDLIPLRRVRYRLFCLWPALWALGSLRHARRDPDFPWGPGRPRLPRGEVWRSALVSTVAVHHPATLRRLYRSTGGSIEGTANPPSR